MLSCSSLAPGTFESVYMLSIPDNSPPPWCCSASYLYHQLLSPLMSLKHLSAAVLAMITGLAGVQNRHQMQRQQLMAQMRAEGHPREHMERLHAALAQRQQQQLQVSLAPHQHCPCVTGVA